MDDDLALSPPPCDGAGGCCPCSCCSATAWRRSVKRRIEPEDGAAVEVEGVDGSDDELVAARVEVGNEVAMLREVVLGQQQTINELIEELEEERNASATATSEAMSMILRLQREKADAQMDARNFKRFAEEQMAHDQEELVALEDALMRREEALQSLSLEIEAYRHRLLSVGIDPEIGRFDVPSEVINAKVYIPTPTQVDDVSDGEYSPVKCKVAIHAEDVHLHEEIDELEKMRDGDGALDKDVVEHLVEENFEIGADLRNVEKFPVAEDGPLDEDNYDYNDVISDDEMNDRVYTVVAEHEIPTASLPVRCEGKFFEFGREEGSSVDIKMLYDRLQALEEDRETMRKAIITMRTEKAQLALLKEMAAQLRKEVTPEKAAVKKKTGNEAFSFPKLIKWLASFVIWRKKVSRSKYTFGLSNGNVGLLLLLDKSPQISNLRCLS